MTVRERQTGIKYRIGFGMLLAAVCMVLMCAVSVRAAVGSVTMLFPKEAAGSELTLYPVAEYREAEGQFVYTDVFADCGVELKDLSDAQKTSNAAEQLAVLAKDRNASGIAGTVDAGGSLVFTNLAPAYYLAVQTANQERIEIQKALVPIPFIDDNGAMAYDAVISPKYTIPEGAVILNKLDDEGAKVPLAVFSLQKKVYFSGEGQLPAGAETGQDGDGRFFWEEIQKDLVTNANGQLAVTNLPLGIYRFVETGVPGGFILLQNPCYFSIEKPGEVKEVDGVYTVVSGTVAQVTVVNPQTLVKISKVDKDGKFLAGAKLVVKSANGETVRSELDETAFTFVTTEEGYVLRRLPPGEYLLCELSAPEGYTIAADVPFTVKDGEDAVNEVTMVDEKEAPTKASLTVTKELTDQQERLLMAEDDVFYVALFEDRERTRRISNVKELVYKNAIRSTATFENLEPGRTYYLGETDEFGELQMGKVSGNGVYAPVYPEDYSVTPSKKTTEMKLSFSNMFYELPPVGYTYAGDLKITKKVLRGTKAYKTKETFYAAVFTDQECTQRTGEVIALSMDGKSEVSVTVPLYVGSSPDDSVTYYVAETDENGTVPESYDALEYQVSIDHSQITMSPADNAKQVVITNTYPEDTPDAPSGNTYTSRSGSSTRTGDETPIGLYVLLMAAAAAVIAGAVVLRMRKDRNVK